MLVLAEPKNQACTPETRREFEAAYLWDLRSRKTEPMQARSQDLEKGGGGGGFSKE